VSARRGTWLLLAIVLLGGACTPSRTSSSASETPTTPTGSEVEIHVPSPPSIETNGGIELIHAVQDQVCPGERDRIGSASFRMRSRVRSETSWMVVATCDDGSKHTVVVTWN
jgi:hypothetical protein